MTELLVTLLALCGNERRIYGPSLSVKQRAVCISNFSTGVYSCMAIVVGESGGGGLTVRGPDWSVMIGAAAI
jgi:hypothetical protein